MDDALVSRWRDGDAKATTAVRNGVRTIAERVLSHSGLSGVVGPQAAARLQSGDQRRELTADVAREVMARRGDNAAQVTAMTLMVAGRHAVESMQEGWPKSDESHLPAQVSVTLALAPHGVAPRIKEAADRHLESCRRCVEALRVIERIVRTQEAMDHGTTHDELVNEAARAEARLASGERAGPSAPPRRRPPKRSATPRKVDRDTDSKRVPIAFLAVPFVALLGLGGWLWMSRDKGADGDGLPAGPVKGLAAIADRSPPEVENLSDLPPEVQFAVGDLASGDCRTASTRFRSARSSAPDEPRLFVLEAGALVCAGDGRRALRALTALDELVVEKGGETPRGAHWYRAQANLLGGNASAALLALNDTRLHDPKHRKLAAAQISAVEAALQ
jgi:hypothetical protein